MLCLDYYLLNEYKLMNGNNNQRCSKRLVKELEDIKKYEDTFSVAVDEKNPCLWKVSFKGAEKTIYAGEAYTLQFKFFAEYVLNIYPSSLINTSN